MTRILRRALFALAAAAAVALAPVAAAAQEAKPKPLGEAELAQLLAPIALYPDALLAQVLMAATYPLDVVQAARWTKANPKVTGKALEDAMQKQPWDPSVKALTAVPTVLAMMSEKLEWTQALGDAFLAQQADVMKTVQKLRAQARAAGTLVSTSQQKVSTTTAAGATVIVIEAAEPEVVYVPAYNPMVVYGTWAYAAYPPYYWYPPGYVATRALWFAAGVAVGHALWGHCDWGRNHVSVNVTRYNSFNRTTINNPSWNHNGARRGAVPYRDPDVARKYNRAPPRASTGEAYRGRPDKPAAAPAARPPAPAGRAPSPGPSFAERSPSGMDRPRAYEHVERGADARTYSARGASSREASARQHGGGAGGRPGRR